MVFDIKMMFASKKEAKTAFTSSGIDFGSTLVDSGDNGHKMALCITATGVTGTSLAFKIEDSADNSTFATVATTKAFTATELKNPIVLSLPFEHRRYLRIVTVPTSVTAGTFTAWIGNDYKLGQVKDGEGWEFRAETTTAASGSDS
jgi:hypothetical protein